MAAIKTLSNAEYDELKRFLNYDLHKYYSPSKALRNQLLIFFMLDCGLRVGELVRLTWHMLNISKQDINYIAIPQGLEKGTKSRDIPFNLDLCGMILNFRDSPMFQSNFNDSSWVFPTASCGKHLTTRSINYIFGFISLTALGRRLNPHILRHTFATRLMRVTNQRIVGELLGHKSASSTQIYTHPNSVDLRAAIDKAAKEA